VVDVGFTGLRRCRYQSAVFGEKRRGAGALAEPWQRKTIADATLGGFTGARRWGGQRYENWYLSMEKLAARSFARRMGLVEWREVSINELRQRLALSLSDEGSYRATVLQGLLYSELLNWLPECGFCSDDEALLTGDLDLASDLSKLLLWDFYPALLAADEPDTTSALAAIAMLVQHREDRFYLLFRSTINKLHQFLLAVS
jgi:hypothetical protein